MKFGVWHDHEAYFFLGPFSPDFLGFRNEGQHTKQVSFCQKGLK